VVILLHGTGGRKEQLSKLQNQLVELGFMAVAPDGRFHGARIPGGATDTSAYNRAIAAAWREKDPGRQTYPLYWQTVFDVGRLIDYLQTRDDVDRTRIGLVGFSKGGIEAWFAAAADPRVAAVVPAISVQSLKWSLENGRWQGRANTVKEAHLEAARDLGRTEITAEVCRKMWNKVLPGILNRFDCPQMLELIAPRPMLILNGENDPICPLPGAEIAFEAARRAYSDYPQRLEIDVARGVAHEVTEDQHRRMISWLVKHLQPDRR
jgi:predicted esterase